MKPIESYIFSDIVLNGEADFPPNLSKNNNWYIYSLSLLPSHPTHFGCKIIDLATRFANEAQILVT